jgi:hypothetical protein
MKSLEELSLFAYGFLEDEEAASLRTHLVTCPSCTEKVRRLKSERTVFERAAAREGTPDSLPDLFPAPVKRLQVPIPLAALAASILLGVLVWLLAFPIRSNGGPESGTIAQTLDNELDRLVTELKSPSILKRELATLALKGYGSLAVEKLEKAKADPALIDACRGMSPKDREVLIQLQAARVALDMENVPLTDIVDRLREASQLDFHISGIADPNERCSFKVSEVPVETALRLLLEPRACGFVVNQGVVIVTTRENAKTLMTAPPPRVPVRFPVEPKAVERGIAGLSAEAVDERDRSSAQLRCQGFAAESALWKELDSASVEARARAADLLRQFYLSKERSPVTEVERALEEKKVDMFFESARFSDILKHFAESLGLPVVLGTAVDPEVKVTFKTHDLIAKNSLKLLLQQFALVHLVKDEILFITSPGTLLVQTPTAPLWATPERATTLKAIIGTIAKGEPTDIPGEPESEDIRALVQASRALEGAAGARCRRAAALWAEKAHLWLIDQPSGAELQSLTEAQRTILSKPCQPTEGESLGALFRRLGLKVQYRVPFDRSLRVFGRAVSVSSLLKFLARPEGVDFYLEDETIILDTSANVRAAVEK